VRYSPDVTIRKWVMNVEPTCRALGLGRAEFGRLVNEGFVEPFRGNAGRYRLVDAISGLARAVAAGRVEPPRAR
jgi:hypothetical protein